MDSAGNLYVTDSYFNGQVKHIGVVKLAAGSGAPILRSVTGLSNPGGVAVDTAGNLYVADYSANRVLKLPAA